MTSKTHWKSTKESHRKVKQTKNWVGKRESQRRRNAQIGDGMGLWWLKSATECSNRRQLGFIWLINDGMFIGNGWLGLLVMECTSVTVGLGYQWRKAQISDKMFIGDGCLGYWRRDAHRWRLAWVIGDEMHISDGWFFRLSALGDDEDGVGVFGVQTLGSEMK